MGWLSLSFLDRRLERAWEQQFAADWAGLDAAISLQTAVFPSLVVRTLWEQLSVGAGPLPSWEALWLAGFLAWAPLQLALAQLRPDAYLRWRTPLVLLARLQRLLTILRFAELFTREAMGLTSAAAAAAAAASGPLPSTPGGTLGMLLWRPGSIASLLSTYTLPLKYTAPCALLVLAGSLVSTAQQCAADCSGASQAQTSQLFTGIVRRVREWHAPWAAAAGLRSSSRSGRGLGSGAGTGTCRAGSSWLFPPSGSGGSGGVCSAIDGCVGGCVAVHSWLQVVLGALLPLLVMWAVEERSRLRFQQQWLDQHTSADSSGEDSAAEAMSGSSGGGGAPGRALPRPVPILALAAWLVTCGWVLWMVAEAALLRSVA